MAEILPEFCGGWIVACTKPQQEFYAQDNVEKQGYECYVPKFRERLSRRLKVLFPSYIFVNTPGQWSQFLSTYGIRSLILGQFGPKRLPEKVITELRRNEDKDGVLILPLGRFKLGQEVRVRSGHFINQIGIYEGLSGRDRIKVLLDILGGSTTVYLRERQVEDA